MNIDAIKRARKIMQTLNSALDGANILSEKIELIVEDKNNSSKKIIIAKDDFAELNQPWDRRSPEIQNIWRVMERIDQKVETMLNRFFGIGDISLFLAGIIAGCILGGIIFLII